MHLNIYLAILHIFFKFLQALAEAQETYNDAMEKLDEKRAQLAEVQVRIINCCGK